MQRPSGVVDQELGAQKIEEHTKRPGDAVVRFPVLAWRIRDRNLSDARPGAGGQSRNEAMQVTIELNVLNDLTSISLKSGAKVVKRHTGQLGHGPVSNLARQAPA